MRLARWAGYLAISLFPGAALAAAPETDTRIAWSGFASMVAARSSDGRVAYSGYPQPLSAARANRWGLAQDSLFGIQADVETGQTASFTAQMIVRQRTERAFEPALEWAFWRYQPDPAWELRLGRVLTPALLESQYRYVGYANTVVRPDLLVYTTFPFSNHDGADVSYTRPFVDGTLTTHGFFGRTRLDVRTDLQYRADRVAGITLTWTTPSLTLRGGYLQTDAELRGSGVEALFQLDSALRLAAEQGCTSCLQAATRVVRTYADVGYRLASLGARIQESGWAAWGEWALAHTTNTITADRMALVLGASLTQGSLSPYATVSRLEVRGGDGLLVSHIDAGWAAARAYDALVRRNQPAASSVALGIRWDAWRHWALKAEGLRGRFDERASAAPNFPLMTGQSERPRWFSLFSLSAETIF